MRRPVAHSLAQVCSVRQLDNCRTELQEIAETAGWIQPRQLSLADLNPEQAQQSLQTMSPLARRVLTAYLQQGGGQVRASILAEQLGEPLDKVRAALEEINFMQ
jgi:hypothetical protein